MKKLTITEDKFNEIRKNSDFIDAIDLGRLSNSLNFCYQTYVDYSKSDSAVGMRQKFRALFFMIGLLREGFKKAEDLHSRHQGQKYFDEGFGKLLQDKKTKEFVDWIERIRHQTVFHFDRKLVARSLENKDFELNEYVVFSTDGTKGGHSYFNLSDELEFFYHFSRKQKGKNDLETVRKALSDVGNYVENFTGCLDIFITGVLGKTII